MENVKITGIKEAVEQYHRYNAGGMFDPSYGRLMLDRSTGETWTDYFYNLGHNDFKRYHDPAVIDLVDWGYDHTTEYIPLEFSADTARAWAAAACAEYAKRQATRRGCAL